MRKFISEFEAGEKITDFFLLKEPAVRTAKSGKEYGQMSLADKTGVIPAKKWDLQPEERNLLKSAGTGTVVKVRGEIETFNGANQFIVSQIRSVGEKDKEHYQMEDLVKASPVDGETLYKGISNTIKEMHDPDYRRICNLLYEKNRERLLYWPAAKAVHHNEMYGLLWHTYRMSESARLLSQVYPSINDDLLIAGVLLHDIGKLTEINSNEYGVSDSYSTEGILLGHLVMGVKIIEEAAAELSDFPEEKKLLLEHMIAAHHGKPEYDAAHKPCVLEAQLLHQLDMIDMYVYVGEQELEKTLPGEFTDRLMVFDRMSLYRPMTEVIPPVKNAE